MTQEKTWWAKGRLFENCNCELMCRAHVRYSSLCDHERCLFHWAVHIDEGAYAGHRLDGLNAVVVGDTPQRMADGGWTEAIYIDAAADEAQRQALDSIFRGRAGGPFAVLASFVTTWLDTRHLPIFYRDEGRTKVMEVEGFFTGQATAIRGETRDEEVVLVNLFNQIHGPRHVLARGTTTQADGALVMSTQDSHAIYSDFSWTGP